LKIERGTDSAGMTGSAISVVNAIATGKGSTLGIEMKCEAHVSFVDYLGKRIVVSSKQSDNHGLVKSSVNLALSKTKLKIPARTSIHIKLESDIPQAVGLKSSSAVSTAVVEAIYKFCNESPNPLEILETSCRASKLAGASITGAYDDAAGCLLGGFILSDNTHYSLLRHEPAPKEIGSLVAIFIPRNKKKFTSDVSRDSYSAFKNEASKAFELAKKRDISGAMLLNSMIQCSAMGYSFAPISNAINSGATAAGISGKGPAVAAICVRSRQIEAIKDAWKELDPSAIVITTRVVKPKFVWEM
jgi:shikimate kinase